MGRRGCVLVATEFMDPVRGLVHCAGAPLVAAEIASTLGGTGGLGVTCGPVAVSGNGETSDAGGQGMLFAASFVDREGRVGGIALAAHRDDPVGLAVAEKALTRWMAVLRSRRVLVAEVAALCAGGMRAVRMVGTATGGERLYFLGRPVIGPGMLRMADGPVASVVQEVNEIPDGGVVVFPAHGVALTDRAQAAARGLRVLDATCPLVEGVQADAACYAGRGDVVVVVGRQSDAVTPVLLAQAGARAILCRTTSDAESLGGLDGAGLAFVVAPGMPVEEAMPIVAVLRRRFPGLAGHHFDVLCDHAGDQVRSYASVAAASDLTLVVAAHASYEAARIEAQLADVAGRVQVVTALVDLTADMLAEATTVGVISGMFTPPGLKEQVVGAIAGLGPVSIKGRGSHTTDWDRVQERLTT